jgi:hypothetical protein
MSRNFDKPDFSFYALMNIFQNGQFFGQELGITVAIKGIEIKRSNRRTGPRPGAKFQSRPWLFITGKAASLTTNRIESR